MFTFSNKNIYFLFKKINFYLNYFLFNLFICIGFFYF